ncbi:MAG: potassium transporter [Parabacteroides sp.]|nr:potassium transporter [Parabacteroides sp.]
MKTNKIRFFYRMNLPAIQGIALLFAETMIVLASLSSLFVLIYQFGFENTIWMSIQLDRMLLYILLAFFIGNTIRYIVKFKDILQEKLLFLDVGLYVLLFTVLISRLFNGFIVSHHWWFLSYLSYPVYSYGIIGVESVIHLSRLAFAVMQSRIKPSLLFSFSFLFVIWTGTGLFMLPNATEEGIDFIDALFMAATSVCVTGLTTIDPATTFTHTGFIIMLVLIQIGGIGVMTFTSFFALSFMGKSSFTSEMMLKDVLNENQLGGLFRVILKIIGVTFIIEAVGVYLVYMQIRDTFPGTLYDKLFFSVFHSVSSFCNAGLSTLSNNLADPLVVHNYSFQFWIAVLIIIGGLGFPIVFNYIKLLQHFILNGFRILIGKQQHYIHRPHIINVYTYIVMTSTVILLVTGTIIYFFAEKGNTLAGQPFMGQLTSSFFGAVTPRTAGFSIVNMSKLSSTAMLLLIFLMAIGASPMSTGGGLKTTTVFVAVITMVNVLRNKTPLEVFRREIMPQNIRRALAILILYLSWLFFALLLLSATEGRTPLFTLFFEVTSALSTVGLSLDYTPHLSDFGKVVIIITMFIGRMGVYAFFIGLVKDSKRKNYTYPQENILM